MAMDREKNDATRVRTTRDIGYTSTSGRTYGFYSAGECDVNQRMSCVL
jgi:hypothetical protein